MEKQATEVTTQHKTTNGKAPAFSARLSHIRVVVWENQSESGRFFNTTISRRYKDGAEFKDAFSYSGISDLVLVAEAVRLAKDFIASQEFYYTDSE